MKITLIQLDTYTFMGMHADPDFLHSALTIQQMLKMNMHFWAVIVSPKCYYSSDRLLWAEMEERDMRLIFYHVWEAALDNCRLGIRYATHILAYAPALNMVPG